MIRGGEVVCWGDNADGQVDPAGPRELVAPRRPLPGRTPVDLALGRAHTCALTDDGAVWCWGADDLGQSGGGGVGPTQVEVPLAVGSIAASNDQSCVVGGDDRVRCWGDVLRIAAEVFDDFLVCQALVDSQARGAP
ncbi:MAG: RCC1 domain-containing protein [Kofleriaceae bacterium]